MNLEQYKKRDAELQQQIINLQAEKKALRNEYVQENAPLKLEPGDRIKVTSSSNEVKYAYFVNFYLYSNDIRVNAVVEKKDGSKGVKTQYISQWDKVEKA